MEGSSLKREVYEVLRFARETAEQELAHIDSVHQRTLRYLGWIAGVVTAVAAILGYVGWKNLQSLAVAEARRQMRTEIQEQVRQTLAEENIGAIVDRTVSNYAAVQLRKDVQNDIRSPEFQKNFRSAASAEAKEQFKKAFVQRHLKGADADRFVAALKANALLMSYIITTNTVTTQLEPGRLYDDILAALSKADIKYGTNINIRPRSATEGLYVIASYTDENVAATALSALFEKAGLKTTLELGTNARGSRAPMPGLFVYVAPAPLYGEYSIENAIR